MELAQVGEDVLGSVEEEVGEDEVVGAGGGGGSGGGGGGGGERGDG